jgi:hypothetical protein
MQGAFKSARMRLRGRTDESRVGVRQPRARVLAKSLMSAQEAEFAPIADRLHLRGASVGNCGVFALVDDLRIEGDEFGPGRSRLLRKKEYKKQKTRTSKRTGKYEAPPVRRPPQHERSGAGIQARNAPPLAGKEVARRDQASQTPLSGAVSTVQIGMAALGGSAKGCSDRYFVGVRIDSQHIVMLAHSHALCPRTQQTLHNQLANLHALIG